MILSQIYREFPADLIRPSLCRVSIMGRQLRVKGICAQDFVSVRRPFQLRCGGIFWVDVEKGCFQRLGEAPSGISVELRKQGSEGFKF